jgi:hypothetical protein
MKDNAKAEIVPISAETVNGFGFCRFFGSFEPIFDFFLLDKRKMSALFQEDIGEHLLTASGVAFFLACFFWRN